jgi:hypothetical protein
MRGWSDRTGQPGVQLVRDALDAIAADPTGAVATAGAGMGAPVPPAVRIPVDGRPDRARWDAATAALDAAFGGAVATGAVVRGLVVVRLNAEG